MIVCRRCGRRTADADEFCGGCSAFLEYDGEPQPDQVRPEPPPPPAPSAAPAPEPPRGIVARVRDAVSGEPERPAEARAAVEPPAAAAVDAPVDEVDAAHREAASRKPAPELRRPTDAD